MARKSMGVAASGTTDLVRKTELDTSCPPTTALTNSAQAAATSALTLTTTVTDVPGATVTITTQVANTVVVVYGIFDFVSTSVAAAEAAVGYLNVDGTNQTVAAIYQAQVVGVTSGLRATSAQIWRVTLATAGSHTLKLRGNRTTSTSGTYVINTTHTTITVLGRF